MKLVYFLSDPIHACAAMALLALIAVTVYYVLVQPADAPLNRGR